MPRYRFDWNNVDAGLLGDLVADVSDEDSPPADWLRTNYGARPRERFVADLWPSLRDGWLAGADGPRLAVVEALRGWSLGDMSLPVDDLDGQLAYLRTCRNAVTLRRVVLDEFIRLGEQAPEPLKQPPPVSSWTDLEVGLARSIEALEPQQFLILSVRGTGLGGGEREQGSAYFVQFAEGGDKGFRAEAVSDAYLAGTDKLSQKQRERMVQVGWNLPSYAPGDERGDADQHASPNWFLDWDEGPVPYADVAALAIATLQDVFGAESPAHLEYQAFDDSGQPVDLPLLGLDQQALPVAAPVPDSDALPRPTNQAELREHVRLTLVSYLEVDDLEADGDGDFAINAGSTVVYVRALSDAPVVRLFAPVLTDVAVSSALIEAVNDIARQYVLLKAVWDGTAVTLMADLMAVPYVGEHLAQTLTIIRHFADELDDQLQQRFGGRTLLGAGPTITTREGNAGYL